ncbi:hypothetical protein EJ08DRAFT_671396 [Tothia fuscella]|uniref:BHLH domain-containing protein n=1 Tax=Tothia fuscella TaxID=1048955 RepID=A0A9P4NN88_9PEZI|nr:hypothetical protein EJ08DRAFT_671396 [Tothia fuscella]
MSSQPTFHNLPTPGPSAELSGGKPSSNSAFGKLDTSFTLPPAAIPGHATESNATTSPSPVTSDSSYRPLSPPTTSAPNSTPRVEKTTRRRSSAANSKDAPTKNGYTIPPPPTRSRKIIQMKPQAQKDSQDNAVAPSPVLAPTGSKAGPTTATAGGKKKQGAANTTAAGRKTARKTAHSLIERRRRSKMNEEFGVLKDMIPACNGQEMHKLAILQASIDYMRYLEQCLKDLKSAHSQCDQANTSMSPHTQPPNTFTRTAPRNIQESRENAVRSDDDSDEEMTDVEQTSPRTTQVHHHRGSLNSLYSNQPSISPAILPSSTTSPIFTQNQREYTYHSIHSSAHPSPAFEPQTQASGPGLSTFKLTSPALRPQDGKAMEKDDHEATAALLMLNTDRRKWSTPGSSSRGMSVRDLLSG